MSLLLIIAGAALGAPLRYFTDRAIQARHGSDFPWGTFAVNVLGSLIFGLLVGAADAGGLPPEVITFAGVGFCGALTTYSTFGLETTLLAAEGFPGRAVLNAVVSLAAGLAAAFAGIALAAAIWA
jgi:CrcB protein